MYIRRAEEQVGYQGIKKLDENGRSRKKNKRDVFSLYYPAGGKNLC